MSLAACSDNYIGGLGAAVLANALQKNTSLQELYIKGNELGDAGVEALCKAFTGGALYPYTLLHILHLTPYYPMTPNNLLPLWCINTELKH